jgi:hypothetical protein
MTRLLSSFLLATAIGLSLGACDGDDSVSSGGGGGGNACSQYSTCDSCTPVNGCGWCFNASGGACAPDPDSCTNASEFTWTWNPSGCPDVDAQVVSIDSGTTVPEASTTPQRTTDAGPEGSATDANDALAPEASATDAPSQ